jgi:hypothetical protein
MAGKKKRSTAVIYFGIFSTIAMYSLLVVFWYLTLLERIHLLPKDNMLHTYYTVQAQQFIV